MSEKSVGEYNYNEEPELGAGNFGTVYLGWHSQNRNLKVAIKLINLRKSAVKQIPKEMLGREVKILQDLSATPHCNLVKLLDFQGTDTKLFFIMEYCNGKDLRKYLNVNGVLRPSVIRLFFLQIAKGTKFLHDMSIIHRDLKPENILLSFDGEPYPKPEIINVKIGDFGLGRYIPEDGIVTTYCGTPEYRAPEIKPKAQYDKKVDLWSIGVMIYECIVGSTIAQDLQDIKLPANTSRNIREVVLEMLLVRQPNRRVNIDQLLAHSLMSEDMHVRVQGFGASARTLVVKKSSFVEALIEKIRNQFDMISEDFRFVLTDGSDLEQHCGSNRSLEDCGISSGCTVTIVHRVFGGKCVFNWLQTLMLSCS